MVRLGKTYGNLLVDLRATNTKLMARARRIVAALTEISEAEADALLRSAGRSEDGDPRARCHVTPSKHGSGSRRPTDICERLCSGIARRNPELMRRTLRGTAARRRANGERTRVT